MDQDYVLGTHDEELARLGQQHAVWRERAFEAWRCAGISAGQRVIDFGCGPGYASLDLAELVGPLGEVLAIDRSARFLAYLEAQAAARGLGQVRIRQADLEQNDWPDAPADAAWCRWIFTFLADPRSALQALIARLRPGGVMVIHEYVDYATWRLVPRAPAFEAFVAAVMESWRSEGGEPNLGPDLVVWLEAAGWQIERARPVGDLVTPSDPVWRWPMGFFESGLSRLVAVGRIEAGAAEAMRAEAAAAAADPRARMMTPLSCEIIARKPL
jgi:SAM-dependent methyltransferase